MSVKQNLIAAKLLIDTPEKWVKGSFEKDGCFCVVGSLGAAETGNPYIWDNNALSELYRALPVERYWSGVPSFNDDPSTTHADIMALFDRAIEACND